jgi:hypothetical protein
MIIGNVNGSYGDLVDVMEAELPRIMFPRTGYAAN